MNLALSSEKEFIQKLTEIVHANLENEQFSVEELAKAVKLSRSYLHRRLKDAGIQSVSHFIRTIRLEKAMEMLQQTDASASEIAYKVGFGSPTYFNQCFHVHFGFPPGEVKKRGLTASEPKHNCDDQKLPVEQFIPGNQHQLKRWLSRHKPILIVSSGILILLFLSWFFYDSRNTGKGNASTEKSIAILPFKNFTDDPKNQYFADGIMDDILNNLYKISDLRVISRTTSEHYRNTNLTIKEIAGEVKARHILEGSVFKSQNKVRIHVQLIDAKNDQHLWSERYDKEMSDIFAIQSDIAFRIANSLEATISPKEKKLIGKKYTKIPEAYNLYLYGRYFWYKRTPEALKKSVEYFEKALATDPDYALAYAGLADAYFIQAYWGWYPMMDGYAKAKEFALKAINIDNNLAEAHAVLGELFTFYEWKWEEARKELILATRLNPNYSTAYYYYAELLDILRENDKAREQVNLAMELDPFFFMWRSGSAKFYFNEGKLDESLKECRKTLELEPDRASINWRFFDVYIKKGEDLKAVESLQEISRRDTSFLKIKDTKIVKEVYDKSGLERVFELLISLELKKMNLVHYI